MNMNLKMLCPCGTKNTYDICCRPFHQGKWPVSALQLMRSRYSAYALCLTEYIIATTHPENLEFCHDIPLWSKKISDFCLQTEFKKLEILDFQEQDDVATVTFVAHLVQDKQDISYTEKSGFKKIKGQWLYLSQLKHSYKN